MSRTHNDDNKARKSRAKRKEKPKLFGKRFAPLLHYTGEDIRDTLEDNTADLSVPEKYIYLHLLSRHLQTWIFTDPPEITGRNEANYQFTKYVGEHREFISYHKYTYAEMAELLSISEARVKEILGYVFDDYPPFEVFLGFRKEYINSFYQYGEFEPEGNDEPDPDILIQKQQLNQRMEPLSEAEQLIYINFLMFNIESFIGRPNYSRPVWRSIEDTWDDMIYSKDKIEKLFTGGKYRKSARELAEGLKLSETQAKKTMARAFDDYAVNMALPPEAKEKLIEAEYKGVEFDDFE
ncbi:MAG: hypothetical protein OXB93_02370 [Cytophagales bacterium]|nr:hypothetical protein [Cytophagales bacterium]